MIHNINCCRQKLDCLHHKENGICGAKEANKQSQSGQCVSKYYILNAFINYFYIFSVVS